MKQVIYWFGILVALVHIYFNTVGTLSELWTSALHFGMFGFLAALIYPLRPKNFVLGIDVLIGLLAALCAVYLILAVDVVEDRGQDFIILDWIFSIMAVLLAVELTRRSTGWIIPILIIISTTYVVWWGPYVPQPFDFPGLPWETVLYRSYFSTDGMFGALAQISSTYVFMFILFGAFLLKSGAGDFMIQLARCLVGRLIGGPGLVAVFGSALMGSISGSAVANTVSTGTITIPLMKRSGFEPRFAAGIEAAASTGGQLMPPVMGAGVFIMASYTQIPYLDIIAVAFLPALLYFLSVIFFVRIEARRLNLSSTEEPLGFVTVMREGGHLLIPLVILIGLLIYGFTPTYAAGIAILSVIGASWLSSRPMGVRDIFDALAMGSRQMTGLAVLLVGVGIIVNVVNTTGIGNTISLLIISGDWVQGNLFITIVLVALVSLVLGMGLPVTAAYIVVGTVLAPALYDLIANEYLMSAIARGQLSENAMTVITMFLPSELAIKLGSSMSLGDVKTILGTLPPDMLNMVREQVLSPAVLTTALLSAHMIVFWLSQDSNVTPPVCLTAFAAATIAQSDSMRTGLMAWKFAKGLYIIPLLFAYTPFLSNDWASVLSIFFFGVGGIYALVGALQGYLEGPVSWYWRIVLLGVGVVLLWPLAYLPLLLKLGGLVLLVVVFFMTRQPAN
ncbi:MAG: TRAP transporter fused permease subunit [Pseudomonadota bacterium]